MELVAEGLTDRAIAARLSLSPRTVSNYLADLYALSGATNRVHLVRLYLTGALTPTPPRGRAGSPR